MKKFLISTLVAASVASCVGGLVACGDKNTGNNDADTAKKAIQTVRSVYDDKSEITDETYTVMGQTKANDKMCTIKWSVQSDFEGWGNYIVVGNPDSNNNNQVTISITKAAEVIEYKLTATVTVGKAKESTSFDRKVTATKAGEDQIELKLSFENIKVDDTNIRTVYTASQQVWVQNDITLTNDKASSSTPVTNATSGDLEKNNGHIRLYVGSLVQIECKKGISAVTFHSDKNYTENLKSVLESSGLGTVTVDADDSNVITLTLTNSTDIVEFTASKQIRLTSLDVVAYKNGISDDTKVAGAKKNLDLTDKKYGLIREYELPAKQNGLDVTWRVKEGGDYVSITNDGKLKVNSLPQANATAVLEATITSNAVTDKKDITITLVNLGIDNDGTAEHPLKPSEAKLVTTELLDASKTSSNEYYVKGFVIAPGTYKTDFKNFDDMYIADTADKATTDAAALLVFRPSPDGEKLTTAGFDKGDEVTFKGNLQHYVSGSTVTPELVGGVCVARDVPDRTDDEVVELAKSNVNLAKTTYTALDTTGVVLPATQNGATLEWEIEGGTSEYVSIEGSKLKVIKLPTSGEVTVTINVTVSYGTATPQTKPIDLTLKAPATAPVGTFKYGLAQETIGKKLYFKGTINASGFAETTEDVSEAVDVVVAATEGGYTIKVGEKYLELYTNADKKVRIQLADTPSTTTAWIFDGELNVFTWTEGGKVYYVGTYSTFETLSPSETKYITTAGNFVAKFEDPASKTDADKINDALALVKATLNNITEIGKVTLPASTVDGVTFVWTLASDNTATCATVIQEDGAYKLNVTALPEDADATVKLVVTASCGDATDKTKPVTVTVEKPSNINYGTVDEPLSVTEALAITAEQCKVKDDVTKQVVTVTGIVSDKPADKGNGYYQYTLKDITATPAKTIVVYSKYNLRDNVATPAQNDTVKISGYIKNFNGTIEFCYVNNTNVYVESNVRGTSTIAVNVTMNNDAATATVTDLEAAALPANATNGTKISFKVAPATGRTITAVKVNGATVNSIKDDEEDENSAVHYELTVAGNMTILVETIAVGETEPVVLKTITFNSTNNSKSVSAYDTTFDATQDGLSWKVDNFNNNNNGWAFIKCGRKKPKSGSGESVAMLTTKTAVDKVIKKVDVTIDSADASLVHSFKLLIADNAEFTNATEVVLTIEAGVNSFVVPTAAQGENKYYRIVIDCAEGTANGFVQLSKVELLGDAPANEEVTPENTPAPEAIVDEQ